MRVPNRGTACLRIYQMAVTTAASPCACPCGPGDRATHLPASLCHLAGAQESLSEITALACHISVVHTLHADRVLSPWRQTWIGAHMDECSGRSRLREGLVDLHKHSNESNKSDSGDPKSSVGPRLGEAYRNQRLLAASQSKEDQCTKGSEHRRCWRYAQQQPLTGPVMPPSSTAQSRHCIGCSMHACSAYAEASGSHCHAT